MGLRPFWMVLAGRERQVAGTASGGRGLYLVDSLAARWGFERDGEHTTTWFELLHH